jgi:predicted nucleic acid-binding protein
VNARCGHEQAIKIGKEFYEKNLNTIITITPEDEKRAWQIFQKYEDKNFSLTDCTSVALMERLKIKKAFAFDIHFIQYGKFSIIP